MVLRLEAGARLVCATHNPGKAREIAALLEDRFEVVTAVELGLREPEEVEQTFVGNAVLKARAAAAASGLIAIADDSGLEVRALGGQPGVLSARWAEQADGKRDFGYAMARVARQLMATESDDRAARFVCALAAAWPESLNGGVCAVVEGYVTGELVFPALGTRGFGYDPIFQPAGYDQTFGEMDPKLKHAISHRADAFAKLKAALF
jgi:XTP/dITP diphosphohydrolase